MNIIGKEIDTATLVSKNDLLKELKTNGASNCALSAVWDRYNDRPTAFTF